MGKSRLHGLANFQIHRKIQIIESEVLSVFSEEGPWKLKFKIGTSYLIISIITIIITIYYYKIYIIIRVILHILLYYYKV
jgi:hypothetical protein